MKATHKGTCQCCGAMQKLPNGVLSNHGYTVDWGMFNGTCQGAGHKPFEKSTDLIESFINQAKAQIENLNNEISEVSNSTDVKSVWYRKYIPATYSKQAHYVWEKRGLLLDKVYSERFTSWKWDSLPTDTKDVNRGKTGVGDHKPNPDDAVKFENEKYTAMLSKKVQGIEGYIQWQEERISGWTEQPLQEIK